MTILYIYRNPKMGISIGKVFKPIEYEMSKYAEIDSIYLPCANYSFSCLWKNILFVRKQIKKRNYDVIHITGAEHYLIPFINRKKTIVTIHDLGFYSNHKNSIQAICKYPLWIASIKLAKKVTFVSEKSYQEALQYTSFSKEQCSIIHNPTSKEFQYFSKTFNERQPTILQIGTKPNKNLENTIYAIKDIPCKLRIIGPISNNIKSLLELHQIDYSNTQNITDEEIIEEYINCDIVNFPSLYEGFGMPIIEGQSIGRVVITSNASPMKEIAGNAAILVNPYDPDSIRKGYIKAIEEHELYIKLGIKNVQRFNIKDIAKQYYNLYKEIKK